MDFDGSPMNMDPESSSCLVDTSLPTPCLAGSRLVYWKVPGYVPGYFRYFPSFKAEWWSHLIVFFPQRGSTTGLLKIATLRIAFNPRRKNRSIEIQKCLFLKLVQAETIYCIELWPCFSISELNSNSFCASEKTCSLPDYRIHNNVCLLVPAEQELAIVWPTKTPTCLDIAWSTAYFAATMSAGTCRAARRMFNTPGSVFHRKRGRAQTAPKPVQQLRRENRAATCLKFNEVVAGQWQIYFTGGRWAAKSVVLWQFALYLAVFPHEGCRVFFSLLK